ncbi:MAG: S-layer homology domain-containing protein [Oscillospiraceae bacterium]|nr:S-layer homology domain-containing protein [Oscillospiraceae bacterium]
MSWCVGQGIIDGVTDTTLEPTQSATRAQLAAIIKRVAKILF